jgi:hypothetical protein
VVFSEVEYLIKIQFIKLLALLRVVFIEPALRSQSEKGRLGFKKRGTDIFLAPYFKTAVNSSLLRLSGFEVSLTCALELKWACDVSIWLMTGETSTL